MKMKPTICECSTCIEVKKRILNPKCTYCGEHHDSRIYCIAEMAQSNPKIPLREVIRAYTTGGKVPCSACGTIHEEGRIGCPDEALDIKNLIRSSSSYFLDVEDGKYTVYQESNTGALKALRYGKKWRDLTGDNLVFNMMVELIKAKERLEKIKKMAKQPLAINKLELHGILEEE